jgi:predicted secreted protein
MREFLKKMLAGQGTADCRSRRVILVPHCALNQNARVAGAAERPSAITELIVGLMERGIGIVQMPCAESRILGLSRAEMDIRGVLQKSPGRTACRRIAAELVDEIQQYRKSGVTVVGIIGKNGSPACGVEETWSNGVTPRERCLHRRTGGASRSERGDEHDGDSRCHPLGDPGSSRSVGRWSGLNIGSAWYLLATGPSVCIGNLGANL